MDANEKPRPLPKTRGRTDTIRITPIRNTTITPDAWGFHSVPGMLSDFQRHTSQRVPSQRISASAQDGTTSPSDTLATVLAFCALPTATIAIQFAASASPYAVGPGLFTSAMVLGSAALCAQQKLPRTVVGSGCLVAAAITCKPHYTPLVSALAVLPLPPAKAWLPWEWGWCAVLLLLMSYLSRSVVLPVAMLGLLWSQLFSAHVTQRRRTRNETLIAIAIAATAAISALLLYNPSLVALVAAFLSAGAVAIFFLSGESTGVSHYDALVCGAASVLVDSVLRAYFSPMVLLQLAALLPTLLGGHVVDSSATVATATASWSILDSILAHDDTRGIFYFFLLNFGFMLVQLLYSMLSHSLGLLSDSIHMFFDCLALLVGLVASILAKFPPSTRFPYGLAMVETVSGFANGCLLLAISIGVLFEAFERISNPVQLEKMTELIAVSILGLLVNLVGIFAFSHGHAHGHSHGHSDSYGQGEYAHAHGHEHEHEHKHKHEHEHEHEHNHEHNYAHKHEQEAIPHPHSHSHAHDHGSDNLQGIFLHIMADTLGSVGVIISTLLTYIFGWSGFDAIASIVISLLIFASAIPLVTSSARSLLLSLSDVDEYSLRGVLNDIYTTPGVVSYTTPKFWNDGRGIRGTIHVQYAPSSNANIVRDKVRSALLKGNIANCVIQMEEEGAPCWCQQETIVR